MDGAFNLINKFKPAIFIENNNENSGDGLIRKIQSLNYTSFWYISSRYRENNFNRAGCLLDGFDINMLCLPNGQLPPAGLNLIHATHFSQVKEGLPIYA